MQISHLLSMNRFQAFDIRGRVACSASQGCCGLRPVSIYLVPAARPLVQRLRSVRCFASLETKVAGDMSGVDLKRALQVSVDAARSAGEVIKGAFYSPKAVEHKGSVDLVTDTDKTCEDIVFSRLKEAFPDHCFIGEETSSAQGFTKELTAAPTWLVDPLDGTTNFVHGFPFVCVSIALAIDTDVVVGVVHNPILGETFTALRGGGACLNSKPISVSKESNLGSALMATEIGVARDDATIAALFDRISKLTAQVRSIRCTGSCACNLASVACGRLDAFFEIGFGGPWDVAAGALLVTEAGGKVLDPEGNPFGVRSRRVLGTNAELGSQIASIIADCKKSPQEPQPLT